MPRLSIQERFMSKVEVAPNGCWLWKAGKSSKGYGKFSANGKSQLASRVAYDLFIGPIPDGMYVCHNCPDGDNPACVNPHHMFLGTHLDNMRDASTKGRMFGRPSLDTAKVQSIRDRIAAGEPQSAIARELGVKHNTINRIANGKTWKGVGKSDSAERMGA